MKSQANLSSSKGPLHGVSKASKNRDKDVTHEEMQALLSKLKELVPNMPKNKKLSKLEIIQYVIDYIIDLQIALETHPSSSSMMAGHLRQSPQQNRQPLGVISPLTNTAINTCLDQEAGQSSKVPDLVSTATTRPVSC